MFELKKKPATEEELEAERVANGWTEPRDTYIPELPDEVEPADKIELFKGAPIVEPDAPLEEQLRRKHAILMATLEEEAERQAEERQQAQIDHDYYDHQQWTAKDALVLSNRGQAPLVFNEARGSIDWLCGTERRLRKDYRVRPREKNDEQIAEVKTKLFKYVDDVNLGHWHRSRAFKETAISGLSWLEEGLNMDPEKELIFSGSETWRRVFRDSRGREFDQSDWRYLHRRKILDLDYAAMLIPKAANHLQSIAGRWGSEDDEADDIWYLGQKLTSAHALAWSDETDSLFGGDYTVRRAGASAWDRGRRNSVELIETWYRVPELVRVFSDGPAFRQIVNGADPRHAAMVQAKVPMYETVKWRMRVMVSTKYQPLWDGPSPFKHGNFLLVPMWGYRRGRDGMTYGSMRGMRDPQDDLNKRRSKALYALSVNQFFVKEGAVDDIEDLREEGARADGVIIIKGDIQQGIKRESYAGDVQQNLEMAEADRIHIRNAGGVTGDNLGQDSSAVSGKAIIAKQEQGSLTSFELFDNFFLAFKLAGQRRMSHIEQFCNQPWVVRIDPQGMGVADWLQVNHQDPITGQWENDITASQADFIVDAQDYRATLTQAAMQSMFELLTQMANFAPQVVLNLLDLVVETADIQGKDEWVARIRKMTGQRDPTKPPTPEEIAADQERMAKEKRMEDITIETAAAKLEEILTKVNKTNADKVLVKLQSLLSGVEAAAQITTMPALAPTADALARAAGFEDETPGDAVIPTLQAPSLAQPDMGMPMSEATAPGAVDPAQASQAQMGIQP
jgi:hypothetical protein